MAGRKGNEFNGATKTRLAHGVALRCSNCADLTVCANVAGDATINLGVASHITAAAPGGPRYDRSLSNEQRRHATNGIWLCQKCGKLVDSDESHYTAENLRAWKKRAEEKTRAAVTRAGRYEPALGSSAWLDLEDLSHVAQLGLAAEETIENVVARLNGSARRDVEAFRNQSRWPRYPVALGVRTDGIDHSIATTGLANLLGLARTLSVVSAPGTGKSTTLVQLADTLLEDERHVAVIVPLAAWSSESVGLLKWVTGRNAFHGVKIEHFMLLAVHGRLTLLLDGWNELDSPARQRLIHQVEELERDYPLIRLAVSTRKQRTDVPIGGPEVRLESLSDAQQLEIAQGQRGAEGEALFDRARRTPGIRELIAIPLYWNTLLAEVTGNRLPQTKEEVLRLFVENHEKNPIRAEILRSKLFDLHRSFLQTLAVEAMASTTTLPGERARSVINAAQSRLIESEQIGIRLQPSVVLDLLVDHELLIRTGSDSFSFQHSQFQEWHASFEVERLAKAAVGNPEVMTHLVQDILNLPIWEEAILFACERMSFADVPGPEPVGQIILRLLEIDPLFAAEIIFRSSKAVWDIVRSKAADLAKQWHTPGRDDRALRFMIATGQDEFAEEVWQIVSDPPNQDGFGVINTSCPFHPSVLGKDWPNRIATLQEESRETLLCGIVRECGVDEMETVTSIAKTDPSSRVREAVLHSLLLRSATRQVLDLLGINDPALWQACAGWVRPEEVTDHAFSARLLLERQHRQARETDPRVKLYRLLEAVPVPDETEKEIFKLISKGDFATNDDRIGTLAARAFQLFPQSTADALVERLRQNRSLMLFEDILKRCPVVDDEAVAKLVLSQESDNREAELAARIAGVDTIGQLIDVYLSAAGERGPGPSTPLPKAYFQIQDRLVKTKIDSLVEAVLKRETAATIEEIAGLAHLFSLHGIRENNLSLEGSAPAREALATVVPQWIETMIGTAQSTRAGLASLATMVGRMGKSELVLGLLRLLDEDARRQELAMQESNAKAGGALNSEAATSWSLQYNQALALIGDDQVVTAMKSRLAVSAAGIQAAWVLAMIWARRTTKPKPHWSGVRPDYSGVARSRKKHQTQSASLDDSFAASILSLVRSLEFQNATDKERFWATELVAIALRMPCRNEDALIDAVMALPIPARAKTELFTSIILTGKILSGRTVLTALEQIVQDAKKEPWLLDQNTGLVERWLEFFPFTDEPSLLLEAFQLFSREVLRPSRMHGVIAAICVAPFEGRESLLRKLADQDGRFYGDGRWLEGIFHCASPATRTRILDDLDQGKLVNALKSGNSWKFARDLAKLVTEDDTFRAAVYERLDHLPNENVRPLLVQVIMQSADIDGLFVLLRFYASTKRKFDTALWEAIDGLVMTKRYFSGSTHAYELHPVDASVLRGHLFAVTESGGDLGSLAMQCLETIDEIRDRHGRLESEPRHPNITSHRPWPQPPSLS